MSDLSEIDKSKIDAFIKILGNKCLNIILSLFFLVCGLLLSIHFHDYFWINRFSCLITVCGFILTMSSVFQKGIYRSQASVGLLGGLDDKGKPYSTTTADRNIGNSVAVGILVTIIGSILNGFGDLILKMIF